jgi:hypothetical protein
MNNDKTDLIKRHILHIKNELLEYERTKESENSDGDTVYLMEVAEKVWVTYTLLLEKYVKYEIYSHQEIRNISRTISNRNFRLGKLYDIADDLHAYHYEGRVDPKRIEQKVKAAIILLNELVKEER